MIITWYLNESIVLLSFTWLVYSFGCKCFSRIIYITRVRTCCSHRGSVSTEINHSLGWQTTAVGSLWLLHAILIVEPLENNGGYTSSRLFSHCLALWYCVLCWEKRQRRVPICYRKTNKHDARGFIVLIQSNLYHKGYNACQLKSIIRRVNVIFLIKATVNKASVL